MDDERVLRKLCEAAELRDSIRDMQGRQDVIARDLLATRRWGIRVRVAEALGISPEAVRQRYGASSRRPVIPR